MVFLSVLLYVRGTQVDELSFENCRLRTELEELQSTNRSEDKGAKVGGNREGRPARSKVGGGSNPWSIDAKKRITFSGTYVEGYERDGRWTVLLAGSRPSSGFSSNEINRPAASNVWSRLPTVLDQVFVVATSVKKGIGKNR